MLGLYFLITAACFIALLLVAWPPSAGGNGITQLMMVRSSAFPGRGRGRRTGQFGSCRDKLCRFHRQSPAQAQLGLVASAAPPDRHPGHPATRIPAEGLRGVPGRPGGGHRSGRPDRPERQGAATRVAGRVPGDPLDRSEAGGRGGNDRRQPVHRAGASAGHPAAGPARRQRPARAEGGVRRAVRAHSPAARRCVDPCHDGPGRVRLPGHRRASRRRPRAGAAGRGRRPAAPGDRRPAGRSCPSGVLRVDADLSVPSVPGPSRLVDSPRCRRQSR